MQNGLFEPYFFVFPAKIAIIFRSADFSRNLAELFAHDQREFDEPQGWQTKTIAESPLITDFPALWAGLRSTYRSELITLAFSDIPDEATIAENFEKTVNKIKF